jgi:excisionase family DNA binding protein
MLSIDKQIAALEESLAALKAAAARSVVPAQPAPVLSEKWAGRDSFSPKEYAEIFNVKPGTVYDEITAGKLPVVKVGRLYRISRRTVERMLEGGA